MKKYLSLFINLLLFCGIPFFASAANENIPGQGSTDDLVTYLDYLYNFGIAIAAILAVFMIAMGAFGYIFTSAGNASKMIDAKGGILNAIVGLVLVVIAFLLLFIINPDLVKGTILGPGEVVEEINSPSGSESSTSGQSH